MNAKTFTTGQRVTITRGLRKSETGTVYSTAGEMYIISLDDTSTGSSASVKATSLKAL